MIYLKRENGEYMLSQYWWDEEKIKYILSYTTFKDFDKCPLSDSLELTTMLLIERRSRMGVNYK